MSNAWTLKCAKTVGRKHLKDNPPTNCQDSVCCLEANGVSVIALSDGCGSSRRSEIGADITTKTLCRVLTEEFDTLYSLNELDVKKKLVAAIIGEIKEFLNQNHGFVADYAKEDPKHRNKILSGWEDFANAERLYPFTIFDATVQFVAVKENKVLVGRLGDGYVGSVQNGNLKILSSEDKALGEENATWYPSTILLMIEIADCDPWENFEIIKIDDLGEDASFFICSDGVADVIVRQENNERVFDLDEVESLLGNADLFEVLEHKYKPLRGIWDDLSFIFMRRGKLHVATVTAREYDDEGHTVANSKILTVSDSVVIDECNVVDSEQVAQSDTMSGAENYVENVEEDEAIAFDSAFLAKIDQEIDDEEFKEYFIRKSNTLYKWIEDRTVTFAEALAFYGSEVEEDDLDQMSIYWIIIGMFYIDDIKQTIERAQL